MLITVYFTHMPMKAHTTTFTMRVRVIISKIFAEPHLFFLTTSLIFGILFILITPPLQGPDEQAHFFQAYKVSEGDFINDIHDSYPKSLRETYKIVFYNDDIRFNINNKYEHARTLEALRVPLNSQNREKGDGYMMGTNYAPVAYTGQAIMILLGRLLGLAPIVLIYLARLGNLAIWILLVYFAIRMSPIGKWPLVVIGIIPMAVFQGAVVTVDTFSNGVLILYLAYVLYLYVQKSKISNRQYALLGLTACMLALGKMVMLVFVPLALLLLFKQSYKNNKKKLAVIFGITTLALFIALVWSSLSSSLSAGDGLPIGTDPVIQLRNLIYHPGEFLFALWNTNFYTWSDGITRSTIGTFGWVDTPMALVFMVLSYVSLFVVMVSNRGKEYAIAGKLTRKIPQAIVYSIGVLYFLGISVVLYAYNTPVNFNIIVGLQGRYFLPLFILPILLFLNKDQVVVKARLYGLMVKIAPLFLLIVSSAYIYIRYYLNTII